MFPANDDEESPHWTISTLADWARLEAKSAAMVDEVLVRAGAQEELPQPSRASRRLQIAASLALCLATLGIAWAWAARNLHTLLTSPDEDKRVAAERSLDSSADEPARFWGPFRP